MVDKFGLGRSGFSEPPTRPLWIRYAKDMWSHSHLMNCLAWRLTVKVDPTGDGDFDVTYQTKADIEFSLKRQPQRVRKILEPLLVDCEAWLWLQLHEDQPIRDALNLLPALERERLREALNRVRRMIRNHKEGMLYA